MTASRCLYKSSDVIPFRYAGTDDGRPATVPFEASPVQVRVVKRPVPDAEDGGTLTVQASGVFRVWVTAEAKRCRLCPQSLCTLRRVESLPHVSTCVQVFSGDVSADAAGSLRLH